MDGLFRAFLDEMLAAIWDKAKRGNLGAIREVIRIMERRARLFGCDEPIPINIGISETEFGERAAELLRITGPGPLYELAKLPPPGEPIVVDCAADGWANVGVDDTPSAASYWVSAEPESELSNALDSCEDDEPEVVEAEEIVEVVAEVVELVPLPPGQRRLPASEVIDENGVPISRSGIARHLGGHDPMRGWRPS